MSNKMFQLFFTALAFAAFTAVGAESGLLRVDTRTDFGGRLMAGTELIGEPDDSAVTAWNTAASADGWQTLSRSSQSAAVCVRNVGAVIEGGRLASNAVWSADAEHLVRDWVVVPSGKILTLAAGSIVKVVPEAGILVEDGGSLIAQGALVADIADDTVGGDSNQDGSLTAPGAPEEWILGGVTTTLARVSFVDGIKPLSPTRTYSAGHAYGALPVPSRNGVFFGGWRTAPDGGGVPVTAADVAVAGVYALYPVWIPVTLVVAPASTNVSASTEGCSFAVTADVPWITAKSAADWVTLQTNSGDGNGTVSFSFTANVSAESRSATISVISADGAVRRDFTIEQGTMDKISTPVIAPADGAIFDTSSRRVTLRCATTNAVIYYTLDGSEPTQSSTLYSGRSFNVFDTVTVKAKAFLSGMLPSCTVSARLLRVPPLAEALDVPLWAIVTDTAYPWTATSGVSKDGEYSARSASISDGQTTGMETSLSGSGTLTFWWKASCEDDPNSDSWDYAVFLVDGVEKYRLDGVTGWRQVSVNLDDAAHTLRWEYRKDDINSEGEDCAWVDQIVWTPKTVVGAVPVTWLENLNLVGVGSDAETAAALDADGDGYTAAQEYIMGTDPTDASSTLKAGLAVSSGVPSVTWTPDLLDARAYTVWGRTNLLDKAEKWVTPTNSTHRFFKVTVGMPQ